MPAPLAIPALAALARIVAMGSRAAPAASRAAPITTRAQQIAQEAAAAREAGRAATQQRMAAMAQRGSPTAGAPAAGAPMSAGSASLAAGLGVPMLSSPLDLLPQRAEGDPAGAMNRRNAPMMSDDIRSETPGRAMTGGYTDDGQAAYDAATRAALLSDMKFSDDVRSETPGRAMTGGYTDDGQAAYAAAARKAIPLARQVTQAAASPSSKSLYDEYNRSMMEEGGGRADLFERARRAEMEEAKGRAEGGKVGAGAGGKDAAIHKALEIIHHLLTRR